MAIVRALTSTDIEALYAVSLATGDAGKDATALYRDKRLMGHIFSAPYGYFARDMCFVVEDEAGVGGFVVGTIDTRAYEARLERDWWPALRAHYPLPESDPAAWTVDDKRCHTIHHPKLSPDVVVEAFPAHVHMNLLPRLQRQGFGTAMLNTWISAGRDRGIAAVHLWTNARNHDGAGFWTSRGFNRLMGPDDPRSGGSIWFGRHLDDGD